MDRERSKSVTFIFLWRTPHFSEFLQVCRLQTENIFSQASAHVIKEVAQKQATARGKWYNVHRTCETVLTAVWT